MLSILTVAAALNCWTLAGDRYRLPPYLLYAVAETESSFDPRAVAYARNGSHSIGLMQINSSWLPKLAKAGVSESDLWDPCTNVMVGGWILSEGVRQYGYTWKAVGSYYAGPYDPNSPKKIRDYQTYANAVLTHWNDAIQGQLQVPAMQKPPSHRRRETQWIGDIGIRPMPTTVAVIDSSPTPSTAAVSSVPAGKERTQ